MRYKILLLNLGYFSGIRGSKFGYVLRSKRYIKSPKKIIQKISTNLAKLISQEKPDIVCLTEIRKGQVKYLPIENYKFYDIETKYSPNGLAKRVPILKKQGVGFISKEKVNFKRIFLKNGTKKLVYCINIPHGIKLILCHFALGAEIRGLQFSEIKEKLKKNKKTIICGDFNIFKSFSELDNLTEGTNLEIIQKEPTFPTFKPSKPLDLFLATKSIKATTKVINADISDHLPVLMEIEI